MTMADFSKSGGPAFPLENPRHLENGELYKQFTGMTMRQWYAGQALAGIIAFAGTVNGSINKMPRDVVPLVFHYADEMIAFEAKEGGDNG